MVRKNFNRTEKSRKSRCESADSGVDTTLNNRVFRQVQASYTQFDGMNVNISLPVSILRTKAVDNFLRSLSISLPENPPQSTNFSHRLCQCIANHNGVSWQAEKVIGLEEDHLDFEPELGDDGLTDSTSKHSTFSQSTVKIIESVNRSTDNEMLGDDSISTTSIHSIGHRKNMLPVPRIDAKDGRQNEYLPFMYSTTRVLLDSSSDEEESSLELNENLNIETEDDISRSQNFDDSEPDSDCNISQEEEDRLLDSDEETEEHEIGPRPNAVEICQIGNSRITLPKFNSSIFRQSCTENDLKRTKPMKITPSASKKKRRKWNLHFEPEVLPTFLFINDVGYIPDCYESDDSNKDIVVETSQHGKLLVICNNNKFVCENSTEEQKRIQKTQIYDCSDPREMVFAKPNDSNFKMPLLPVKRPPTRPKRTVCNSNKSTTNLQIQVVNRHAEVLNKQNKSFSPRNDSLSSSTRHDYDDKDDSISLIASTIGDDIKEDKTDFLEMDSSVMSKETAKRDDLLPSSANDQLKDRVESWIQSMPNPQPPEVSSIVKNSLPEQRVYDGITFIPPVSRNGPPRTLFKDIPPIFSGLCYFYYFNGQCAKSNPCTLMHWVNRDKYVTKFKNSSQEHLKKGYQMALKHKQLFAEIYPCFLMAFGFLKMYNELTKSIKDFLQISYVNITEALELVIESFVDSGLTFLDTIERISFNVGFLEHPILADILLDLITRKPSISENWTVIGRIAKARGRISPDIACRLLNKVTSVYPVNKKLCLDIYNFIIENDMTDLSRISDDVLAPFRAMTGFQGLEDVTVKIPASIPAVRLSSGPSEKEQLAVHINNNLVKERERFERKVAGRTVITQNSPATSESVCYSRSFDYKPAPVSDSFSLSFDMDDRYFMPNIMQESFQARQSPSNRILEDDGVSPSCSNDDASPNNSLHFEPPELLEYVPETVRKVDMRNETLSRNYSPLFERPTDPPPPSQNLEVTLTPAMPIFGNPCYHKNFKLNVSLHNLLPDSMENVNINERDVVQLNYAIKSKNVAEFCRLVEYYKMPTTIRNFITMMIAHLKSCTNGPYALFMELVQALEMEMPDYAKDIHMKVIFEVTIMNILFELERRGQWDNARKLLEKFCDWDSLVSSRIFPRKWSHMGRYIFLAKIFANGRNYHFVSEIMQCPGLHLLESCDNWPYPHDLEWDLKNRNTVLTNFFQKGYRYNIVDVSNMFRRVYKYSTIHGYDPYMHFNPMLISIMNNNQTSLLKHFYRDIDVYCKVMDKNVLRAFTISLSDQLGLEELFRLYEMCCHRQIYTYYSGGETTIIVRTNMLNQELQLILSYYLEKLSKSGRPPKGDLLIIIKLFDAKALYPKMLHSCVRSVQEINEKVKEILANGYGIRAKESPASKPTVVEVRQSLLGEWLQRNQRRYQNFATC